MFLMGALRPAARSINTTINVQGVFFFGFSQAQFHFGTFDP